MIMESKTREELLAELKRLQLHVERINEDYQKRLSELHRTQENLKSSLSLIEATLDTTENGILVIGSSGRLLKANRRFAELWRIPQEIIDSGDDDKMLRHIVNQLADPDSFLRKVQDLYASPYEESFDLLHFSDGRIFERISKPMIVGKEPVARVWSFRDITEITRLDLERQVMFEITEGFATTSNLDEMLQLIHHSLKKVLYAENCFVALFNRETDSFNFPYFIDQIDDKPAGMAMGKSCTSFVFRTRKPLLLTPEKFQELQVQGEVELVGTPSPSWVGVPLETPDSTIGVLVLQHYREVNVFKERDVIFLEAIGRQMALAVERKNTEAALYDSERKYRRLVTNLNDVVYSVDGKSQEFTYISPSLENLLGYTPEEVAEMGGRKVILPNVLPAEIFEEHSKRFSKLSEGSTTQVYRDEQWWRHKDGSVRCIEDQWIPIYENGILVSTDGILRDVTERKNSEEEIRRINAKLKEIIDDKDKFFSIIAHDLRSPFSSFLGFTQLLSDELDHLNEKDIKVMAESMKNTAFNVYHLLENLLEWSRFQRGLTDFKPVYFEFLPLVKECLELIYESGRKKEIAITYDIADDLEVYADRYMLSTILRNLLSNAVKFTPKGGEIVVSAKLLADENKLEIFVKDSGIGMSEDMLKKQFNVKSQVNRKGTEGEASSGLGLIICKEFVDRHGGTFHVDSNEKTGSTFSFTIPAPKSQEKV